MNLLKDLSPDQAKRLVECICRDEGLTIAVGKFKSKILSSVKNVHAITSGQAVEFCNELKNNVAFADTFKSMIFRIQAPDDFIMEFLDFRDEAWPEE